MRINARSAGSSAAPVPEVSLVDIRRLDGSLIRRVTHEQAELLSARGMATWRSGHLRMTVQEDRTETETAAWGLGAEDSVTVAGLRSSTKQHRMAVCEGYGPLRSATK